VISGLARADNRAFEARRRWAEGLIRAVTDGDGLVAAPQAEALLSEMVHVFCAGAWLATVILAQAVLDADLVEGGRLDGATLNELRLGRGYVWLRNRRNALLHADGPGPAVTTRDLASDAEALERDARRAVDLVVKGLAGRP
jgi:hypothetical protein